MANTYNTVSVGVTAVAVVAANTWRRGATIFNNGSVTIYVGPDASVTTANGIPIGNGGSYDFNGFEVYKGTIYGISGTASQDIRYFEWTK